MGSRLLVSPPYLLASEPPRRLPVVVARPRYRPFSRCRHLTSRISPPPVSSVGSSWADSDESLHDGVGGWFVRKLGIEQEENGFKFCFTVPFHTIYEKLMPVGSEKDPDSDITSTTFEVEQASEINMDEEAKPKENNSAAQAAVVLTSGRTADAIQRELSRLEAENISRLHEEEEIRCEFVQRGDIQRFWEETLAKEQDRHLEVEKGLDVIFLDLEDEKASLDGWLAEYAKEKAALDCQQHLVQFLKVEVEGMNDKLASERANFISEQQSLERFSADLCGKKDGIVEAKSILEAEIEATRILR
ncbi:hypothetical protein BHE74_00028351 [Ensete ventricosum]|nr:hypothetical protein BHE74_00028351 [Ensete ventricosum]RZS06251.1 hypothetical protein BHM03_00036875 [Ensete ventricosum]